MKKAIISLLFVIISLVILSQAGILDALLAFLLVGAVPGTAYSIPSGFMLLLMAIIPWVLIIHFFSVGTSKKAKRRSASVLKKSTPRRRYSRI